MVISFLLCTLTDDDNTYLLPSLLLCQHDTSLIFPSSHLRTSFPSVSHCADFIKFPSATSTSHYTLPSSQPISISSFHSYVSVKVLRSYKTLPEIKLLSIYYCMLFPLALYPQLKHYSFLWVSFSFTLSQRHVMDSLQWPHSCSYSQLLSLEDTPNQLVKYLFHSIVRYQGKNGEKSEKEKNFCFIK